MKHFIYSLLGTGAVLTALSFVSAQDSKAKDPPASEAKGERAAPKERPKARDGERAPRDGDAEGPRDRGQRDDGPPPRGGEPGGPRLGPGGRGPGERGPGGPGFGGPGGPGGPGMRPGPDGRGR